MTEKTSTAWSHLLVADDDMVDYLEIHQEGDFALQEVSYETTRKEAGSLLNLLVTGIGGSTMLLLSNAGTYTERLGFSILATGWVLCAGFLLFRCVRTQARYTRFHPVETLLSGATEEVALSMLKRRRIPTVAEAITILAEINGKRSRSLDMARYGAVAVPMMAFVVCFGVYFVHLLACGANCYRG